MNWFLLILASVLEIGWVISLKYTEGFTKTIPIIFYAFFGFTSAYCFSNALKSIPLGIAYSIWMGIAIIGTTIAESYIYDRPFEYSKLIFVVLIIAGIIGLKVTSIEPINN
ncbi:MAG: multidrug efflux SMR transporter [Rhodothermaceae bacterium]